MLASLVPAPTGAIAASLLAALFSGVSKVALAQVCSGTTDVTCSGTFTSNINVNGGPSDALRLTLLQGVIVNSPGGAAVNAANLAGPAFPSGESVTVTAGDATVTNIMNSTGANNAGLRIQSAGSAIITSSGKIELIGTGGDNWAILDVAQGQTGTATAMFTYGAPGAPGLGISASLGSGGRNRAPSK